MTRDVPPEQKEPPMDFKTRCARGVGIIEDIGRPLSPPIVTASTFSFESQAEVEEYYERGRGFLYSRYENPTVASAERFLAQLEEGEAAALFASGMAAISTTLLSILRAGKRVAAQAGLYGGTIHLLNNVLPEFGIETTWFDRAELETLSPERLRGHEVLYLETPTNPTLRIVDLRRAAKVAREAGVVTVVDSTFASPALQTPLTLGCDVVVHSGTKYLGGHSDITAGAVVGSAELIDAIRMRRRVFGGILDSFQAFLLQRGMRTLAVRMEAHTRGAGNVARSLLDHAGLSRVLWPGLAEHPDHAIARSQMSGFGGMVTIELKGGAAAAERLHDRLRMFVRAPSLGGIESLVSIPARMSHRHLSEAEMTKVDVTPGMVRLSIGLESPDSLVADLLQGLT